MYLLDTNIWLELLLEQEKAGEVRKFLKKFPSHQVRISDFSLYSIGIILANLKREELFKSFILDVIENAGVVLIRLNPSRLKELPAVSRKTRLDFDDAYQYLVAHDNSLTLVSFDGDFDHAGGRKTPAELLAKS